MFVRHLASHVEESTLPALEYAGDLWIACACALSARGAASAFEKIYRPTIERAVAQVDRGAIDEATQSVLVSLLVKEGEGPLRIAGYGGRASLRTWLTTVATRTTLRLRKRRDDRPHESLTGLADAVMGDAPEIAMAKARHGPDLETALRTALASLEARQVALLRLHHARGMSIDRLGAMYRVGRSTAARWVSAARDALLEETKRLLRERLDLTPSELTSLVTILQSNLEVSLVRLLDGDGPDT